MLRMNSAAVILLSGTQAIAQQSPTRPGLDAPALAALGPFGAGYAVRQMGQAGRLLSVSVWYPAQAGGGPAVTYRAAMVGPDGEPAAFTVPGIAVSGAPVSAGRFPLVILAHGYDNTPEAMAWLGENLATKGYIVAAPAFVDPPHFDLAGALTAAADRPRDVAAITAQAQRLAGTGDPILSHADAGRTALIGYSMGAYGVLADAGAPLDPGLTKATGGAMADYVGGAPKATTLLVAQLKALVAIAPPTHLGPLALFAPGAFTSIKVPTFLIDGSQDNVVGYGVVRALFAAEANAPRYLLTFREAGHNIALTPAPPEMHGRLWDQDWFEDPVWAKARLIGIEAHFITAFLDRYVKGDASKAAYTDGLVADSDDGIWAHPPGYGAFSPGLPDATLWKGFQVAHATGMTLEFRK